jgi:hypothetical protein
MSFRWRIQRDQIHASQGGDQIILSIPKLSACFVGQVVGVAIASGVEASGDIMHTNSMNKISTSDP